jgi:hypothetical protein
MQSEGSLQEPVLAGAGRGERSLVGLQVEDSNAITAAVERVWDNRLRLGGGAGLGLNPGCELRRVSPSKQESRYRGQGCAGLIRSSDLKSVHRQRRCLFQVTRWAAPEAAPMSSFPRAPVSMAQLSKLGAALSSYETASIDRILRRSPSRIMSWSGKSWILNGIRRPACR